MPQVTKTGVPAIVALVGNVDLAQEGAEGCMCSLTNGAGIVPAGELMKCLHDAGMKNTRHHRMATMKTRGRVFVC